MKKEGIALEELKLIHNIIHKQEDIRFKIQGWCIALVTGVSVAFVSDKILLDTSEYAGGSILILLIFMWLDVIHRVAQDRAIKRSSEIEAMLAGEEDYDGPKITQSLRKTNDISQQLKTLNNLRVYAPYMAMLASVILLASIS